MRLLLSPQAQADLSDIWDFSAERWGVAQAERYVLLLRDAAHDIASGHKPSQQVDEIRSGYFKAFAGSHTFWFVRGRDSVVVVRILHQAMDPDRHLPG